MSKTTDAEAAAAAPPAADDTGGIKVPKDLSRVSLAKAKELADAGLVEDRDLPGKFYKRKADGFTARIPDYTYEAYAQDLKDEWDEIKLTTDPEPPAEPAA